MMDPRLNNYTDERLQRLPFLLTRTQIYKLRRGMVSTAEVPGLDANLLRMDDSHLIIDNEPEVNVPPGPPAFA